MAPRHISAYCPMSTPSLDRLAKRLPPACLRSTTHRGDSSRAWGLVGGPLLVISVCVSRGASGTLSLLVGECRFTFGFMAGI